ncbi:MAG TPA: ScyD/ScyE family protein [Nodularia sp. (in: cyanobacteria)]|nr:ScyD/ScyE family protein [Nodularia sp. (in: cyanobacteria)]
MKIKQLTITLLSVYVTAFSGMKAAEAASFTVIADNLNNPGGLSFSNDGKLYITESGTGGNGACVPPASGEGDSLCYGTNGVVSVIENGQIKPVLTELPSLALPDGKRAAGPRDIQFDASGQPYVLVGYGTNPIYRDGLGETDLGTIIVPNFETNSWKSIADITNYELLNNPDGDDLNSNPLKILIDGNQLVTVDSAANDLLSVNTDGSNLQAIAVLPQKPLTNPVFPPSLTPSNELEQVSTQTKAPPLEVSIQSVPTGVAKGLDGAYYISEYTGFPFPEGGANIYRVGDDGIPTIYAEGFTQLMDLEFDQDGNLYALQYANESAWKGNQDGALIKIAADGDRTNILSGNGLESPTALTIGLDGSIYIANRGDRPGEGQIIRIDNIQSVPEPNSALGVLTLSALGCVWLRKNSRLKPLHQA